MRHSDLDDEQRDRDGEDAVAEGFQPPGIEVMCAFVAAYPASLPASAKS
jgi:hypothetical protein